MSPRTHNARCSNRTAMRAWDINGMMYGTSTRQLHTHISGCLWFLSLAILSANYYDYRSNSPVRSRLYTPWLSTCFVLFTNYQPFGTLAPPCSLSSITQAAQCAYCSQLDGVANFEIKWISERCRTPVNFGYERDSDKPLHPLCHLSHNGGLSTDKNVLVETTEIDDNAKENISCTIIFYANDTLRATIAICYRWFSSSEVLTALD